MLIGNNKKIKIVQGCTTQMDVSSSSQNALKMNNENPFDISNPNNEQINGMQLNTADGYNEPQNLPNFGCTSATPDKIHQNNSLPVNISENSLPGTKNKSMLVHNETEALHSGKPKLIHQIEVTYSDMVLCFSSLDVDFSYAEGEGNKTVTIVRDQIEGNEILDRDLHKCFCISLKGNNGESKT